MKMGNKYNRTIRKEDLDIGMEYRIKAMICVTTKYGKKIVIIIGLKAEMVDLFEPNYFDSKVAGLDKKLKKIVKGMILKAFERKGKDSNNNLDTDTELSTKY